MAHHKSVAREYPTRVFHKSECSTGVSNKSVLRECPIRQKSRVLANVSHKTVPQRSPTRVSQKIVPQEFSTRVSHQNVRRECCTRVAHQSVQQECLLQESPARVSHKSFAQECPTKVSRKSAPQECQTMFGHLFLSACLHSGSLIASRFI